MTGKVYIVGAGPGPADLLTLRAASVLRSAGVVLHDDLVLQDVLDLVPPSAELINVGKRCGRHGSSQEQINELMISYAQAGRAVVRLKSGDPAVFGRLGEELDALRAAAIAFEIIPGVTAAAAAAVSANLTLTDRRAASVLVLVTAHHCARRQAAPLFQLQQATYAVYMPGPDYANTAEQIRSMGLSGDTPCALVSHAGRNDEQVFSLKLSELPDFPTVPAPAILLVGDVTASMDAEAKISSGYQTALSF